jgi:hypothetical protein
MTEQDQRDGQALRELLDSSEDARRCLSFVMGEEYSLEAFTACYGCGDGDKTFAEGVKRPEFAADDAPTPEQVAAKFGELLGPTPTVERELTADALASMGSQWEGMST